MNIKLANRKVFRTRNRCWIQYAIEKGFDIYQIYSDEDYSGIDRNRPAFTR